jgi:histidinol dehydrogenase
VAAIVDQVKQQGDAALHQFAQSFDGVTRAQFRLSEQEKMLGVDGLDPALLTAISTAKTHIETFHRAQYPESKKVETAPGVVCEWHWRAIETVGIYVPGGTAPLFSSVLMQAIPAMVAGCKRVVLCTPPQRGESGGGSVHPAILAAARLCGITEIFALGGAQAIAAMAFGTASVPKVDKIFGPGNAYVTMAKQLVSQDPAGAAIDLPAGPSEVMVIADAGARADWVAADLLAQAEHDGDAHVVLLTTCPDLAAAVAVAVEQQLALLPRQAIAAVSIAKSHILVVADMDQAVAIANSYAPEHLIIHHPDAASFVPRIQHAGSVFVGEWTPESVGDYASGTNHVLPTSGYARAYSGLTVLSFMKSMTVQQLTRQGLEHLAPTVLAMAQAEGLAAHANAVAIRLKKGTV